MPLMLLKDYRTTRVVKDLRRRLCIVQTPLPTHVAPTPEVLHFTVVKGNESIYLNGGSYMRDAFAGTRFLVIALKVACVLMILPMAYAGVRHLEQFDADHPQ